MALWRCSQGSAAGGERGPCGRRPPVDLGRKSATDVSDVRRDIKYTALAAKTFLGLAPPAPAVLDEPGAVA